MAASTFSATGRAGQDESTDTGLFCLRLLGRYHDLALDVGQLRHQFGQSDRTLTIHELVRAAKHVGLKAGVIATTWEDLAALPLPAIAGRQDGRYVVLAKVSEDTVLIQDPLEPKARVERKQEYLASWNGTLLLCRKRADAESMGRAFDLTWFVPVLVKYRWLFGEVLAASFVLQLFALLTPLFTQIVIDKVLVHKGFTTLHVLAVGMLALALFDALLGGLRTYLFAHTTNRIDVGLGTQLFRHLLALPLAYFEARRVGDTVARVRELEQIRQFLTSSSVTVVLDLFFIVVFLGVMWLYSPTLTMIVIASLPLYVLLAVFITPAIRARLNDKFSRAAENQAFLVETVSRIHTVKALAGEPPLQRRWEEQLAGYVNASFRATTLATVAGQVASFIQKGTTVALVWIGAYQVIDGVLSIGELIAFNMLAGQVSGPLLRVVNLWQEFQQVGVSVQRLGDVLNVRPEPTYNPTRTTLPVVAGRIDFEEVTFRYRPDGPPALRQVSMSLPPGGVIGIVGRSGSGKSTVARLLQRLHVPERGRVLVDGVDVAQMDPAWLRRQIGVVLQDSLLFNQSVRSNIALTDPGLSMDRVIRAAKLAGAHEFILGLPEGYDTIVGEHGCALSGGQRQRIAIARALVANPRILIFDEATSALDYESEAIIRQNMALISKGRTVILIAHRLSTVRCAQRIYAFEKGQIVEQGTHDELLQSNGLYARFHRHQEGRSAAA